jgi:hypothetical protein
VEPLETPSERTAPCGGMSRNTPHPLGWRNTVALASAMDLPLAVERSRRCGAACASSDATVGGVCISVRHNQILPVTNEREKIFSRVGMLTPLAMVRDWSIAGRRHSPLLWR